MTSRRSQSSVIVPIPDHLRDSTLRVGHRVTYSKTVGETDVYMFAGITGDLSPNHVNEEYMRDLAERNGGTYHRINL